jgi:hypothetical protein
VTARERLSATVESDALAAGRAAVASGRAPSLRAWVNSALVRQAEHDVRLAALEELVAEYEATCGEITADEIAAASRSTRARAVVVRPSDPPKRPDEEHDAGTDAA